MIDRYLNAVVFLNQPNERGNVVLKYHNVKDSDAGIASFCKFIKGKNPTAREVNFYYKRLATEKRGRFKVKFILE